MFAAISLPVRRRAFDKDAGSSLRNFLLCSKKEYDILHIIGPKRAIDRAPRGRHYEKANQEGTIMKSFEYTITDPVGIHARPAGILVKEIKKYASTVTVSKGEKSVNALKLMGLMSMGIKKGDTVRVDIEGADEETAAAEIEAFFKANL
jgi:phosphocarrier protein